MTARTQFRFVPIALAAAFSVALAGCATSGGSLGTGSGSSVSHAVTFGGRVHGGNQPVVGATVTLWAAGAPSSGGGYGTGATSVKTAFTASDGSFTFDTGGVSPCSLGQYLYVTASGGNTGAGTNPYSAMMAALPTPCSSATGSTFIWINEVTTVAAVTALQQFMGITPGGTPAWQIGAPSTNITGLKNAFLQTAQLASITTGTAAVSTVASSAGGVGYTTTITPDISRINTLADILAACVNTAGTSVCTSLFADTTPGSSTTPTDTIQAAYYLATNPAGLTMPAHSALNSPTYLCNQYVAAAGSPFLPTLVCGPTAGVAVLNDWVIGVSWATNVTGATTCGTSGAVCIGTVDAASLAIDQSGNIWVGAGSGVTAGGAIVTEFNQSGQEILTPVGSVSIPAYNLNFIATSVPTSLSYTGTTTPISLSYGRAATSIAIDTNNNAWFDSFASTSPGTLTSGAVSLPTGIVAQITPAGVATGFLTAVSPGALAIDGYNNLYMDAEPSGGRFYVSEVESASQSGETGSAFQTVDQGSGRSSSVYSNIFVDSAEYAWGMNSNATCGTSASPLYIDRTTTAGQEAVASSSTASIGMPATAITDAVGCAFAGAADASGNAWVEANGNLYYLNVSSAPATPSAASPATVTTISGTTNTSATGNGGTGGLDSVTGLAIDGVGNVWATNKVLANSTGVVGGVSEFVPVTSGQTTTYTALSPGGSAASQAGVFGFNDFNAYAPVGVVIDSSGNLWFETSGGAGLWHIVGAAAPVVTPIALAIKNGALGTRP